MKNFLVCIFCCLLTVTAVAQQVSWNTGSDYTWKYNFGQGEKNGNTEFTGSGVSSISTKDGAVGFLPRPVSGNAKVAVGSTGGAIFTLDETDEDGNRADVLKFQASSSDNLGRVSFYNIEGASPLSAVFVTLNFDNNEVVDGNFRLALGYNDNNPEKASFFSNTSSLQNATAGSGSYLDVFNALRWTFSTDPTKIKAEYRELTTPTIAAWKVVPFDFNKGTEYALEILCNNTNTAKTYVRSGNYTVPAGSYHIWANGVQLKTANNTTDFPANELATGTAINSLMMQGSQSKGLTSVSTNPLVFINGTGTLTYEKFANQGETNKDNIVPDFSNAGYMGGGVALPIIPVKETLSPVIGNNLNNIQNAINRVSNLAPDANGFRGAVLLQAGYYDVNGTISIKKSGVVLRGVGQGSDPASNTVVYASKPSEHTFIRVEGSGGSGTGGLGSTGNKRTAITTPYVATGAKSFNVASASGYSVGDSIGIYRVPNNLWIDDLGMAQYGWVAGDYDVVFERQIVAINGNTITLNAPVVDPIQTKYGGGYIFKTDVSGRITHSGVENMRLTSYYASDTDENHGWEAIKLVRAYNCWVKKVTAQYFGYSCVSLSTQSSNNTIEECAMVDPKSQTTGGRKYSFNMTSGSFNLFQRLYTYGGRHDFVLGARTAGPNVFLDCYADNTQNDMGPHQRWATGVLFDNIRAGIMHTENRKASGTGHGWAGAQMMFWNCQSYQGEIGVYNPKGAINWVIGSTGLKKAGTGYFESWGTNVVPRSLYLTQLKDRLGVAAVENITTPAQRIGNIYNKLSNWKGGGDLNNY